MKNLIIYKDIIKIKSKNYSLIKENNGGILYYSLFDNKGELFIDINKTFNHNMLLMDSIWVKVNSLEEDICIKLNMFNKTSVRMQSGFNTYAKYNLKQIFLEHEEDLVCNITNESLLDSYSIKKGKLHAKGFVIDNNKIKYLKDLKNYIHNLGYNKLSEAYKDDIYYWTEWNLEN